MANNNNNLAYPLINALIDSFKGLHCLMNKMSENIPYELKYETRIGNSISVPLGKTSRSYIYLNINQSQPHTLVVGNTGQGKSNCIKSIVTSLLSKYPTIDLYLLDYKAVELNIFSGVKQCQLYEYDHERISDALKGIYNLILEKYQEMLEKKQYKANVYSKVSILIVEEISLATKQDIKMLQKILSISRAINFYCILSTQRPSCDIISPVLRALISNRICFKVSDKANSNICIEQEGAELLECVGRAYLKDDNSIIKFQAFNISDNNINEVVEFNSSVIKTSTVQSDNDDWINNFN